MFPVMIIVRVECFERRNIVSGKSKTGLKEFSWKIDLLEAMRICLLNEFILKVYAMEQTYQVCMT